MPKTATSTYTFSCRVQKLQADVKKTQSIWWQDQSHMNACSHHIGKQEEKIEDIGTKERCTTKMIKLFFRHFSWL